MRWVIVIFIFFIVSCQTTKKIEAPQRNSSLTGNDFYHQAFGMKWRERDSFAVKEILAGNIPSFLKKFKRIKVSIIDSVTGKTINAEYFVSPDYLSLGTDNDWARINITPQAAQKIADSLNCFLPTRKIVDDIYKAAKIKLEPVPMFAFRDSRATQRRKRFNSRHSKRCSYQRQNFKRSETRPCCNLWMAQT